MGVYAPQTAYQPKPEGEPSYLEYGYGWRSWLFTIDHKRIGILYLVSVTQFFFVGGAAAVLVRVNLATPTGVFSPDTYNKLFSAHGIITIFAFLIPVVPGVLGKFFAPIMIGARDMVFRKMNLLSW